MESERALVVDSDMHVIEPADLWQGLPVEGVGYIGLSIEGHVLPVESVRKASDALSGYTLGPELQEAVVRGFAPSAAVAAMDREGIDVAVLFPTRAAWLAGGLPEADPALIGAACGVYNRWIARYCVEVRKLGAPRCAAVGLVGMYDVPSAIATAHHAIKDLRLWGVVTQPTPVCGRSLSDPIYDPFYAAVAALGVPLIFHSFTGAANAVARERCETELEQHVTSHLYEAQLAILRLLPVMERHPRLRVGFFEAGAGWLPSWLHRLDDHALGIHGAHDWPLERRPSHYFKRQGFVTCDAGEELYGIEEEGLGGNVLFASDWPHADSQHPHAVRNTRSAVRGLWRRVSNDNATALWRL